MSTVAFAQTTQPTKPQTPAPAASKQKSRHVQTKQSTPKHGELEQNIKFKDFEIKTYSPPSLGDHASFEVLKGAKKVYEQSDREAQKYRVGCINDDDDGNAWVTAGKDITGQGKPNAVVSMWTGGAHCCFSYTVLELGDEVKRVGSINAGHGDTCRFRREADGRLDFVVSDWTFAYWHTSFAESPAPDVILRYEHGEYVVAAGLMRKTAPSASEFDAAVKKGQKLKLGSDGWPGGDFWAPMLDWIYTGHADLAWKYCDLAWPGKPATKEKFLSEFRQLLSQSPYWPAIKAM